MNSLIDQQLLRDYAKNRSDMAFAELVRRHLDFVYSAALRMVRDPHLAKDVTQGVFLVVSQNATRLADHPVLVGWLHRTTQNLAAKAIRTEVRRRDREQESVAMNDLLAAESDASWEQIAPELDAALGELSETDRDALLLRYFQRKSAREISEILATSEEAAQKRVNRAVERMREIFIKRGISIGAGSLAIAISANAVQAAPVGLIATITAATSLAGATIASTTTATQAIAMTALQKALIGTVIIAALGTGIYQSRQASGLRNQLQTLQQREASLSEQIDRLTRERDEANRRLASLGNGTQSSNSGTSELLKLRAEVTRLRNEHDKLAQTYDDESSFDPVEMRAKLWLTKVKKLKEKLEQMPGEAIPELKLLTDQDWLEIAKDAEHIDSPHDLSRTLARLRKRAKEIYAPRLSRALREYARANNNQLPPDVSALKPYFATPVADDLLQRYELARTGELNLSDERVLMEKSTGVKIDTVFKIGATGFSYQDAPGESWTGQSGSTGWGTNDIPLSLQAQIEAKDKTASDRELKSFAEDQANERDEKILAPALKAFSAQHNGREPESPSELSPYLQSAAEKAAFNRLIKRNNDEN